MHPQTSFLLTYFFSNSESYFERLLFCDGKTRCANVMQAKELK